MASERVNALSHDDITRTAENFRWSKQMPKWTVIVNGQEFPARPLVLDAAGAPPNDPTNSHQAVAKLKDLGFDVLYEGTWERKINGRTYKFEKVREKENVFLYGCEHRAGGATSRTGFHSDRDLPLAEVERLPQFADFLAGKM